MLNRVTAGTLLLAIAFSAAPGGTDDAPPALDEEPRMATRLIARGERVRLHFRGAAKGWAPTTRPRPLPVADRDWPWPWPSLRREAARAQVALRF